MRRRRQKVSRKKSRKLFQKTAGRTKRVNVSNRPMRGGWRL